MKIAVGGMISSGKSTLTKELGKAFDLPVMEEFEKNDDVFNTLLQWLYEGRDNVEMLLQTYFLHVHWAKQQEYGDFVVDRDIIEHWLFAQHNLQHLPVIHNMYNGVFHAYMNTLKKPDLYLILDVNWEEFKNRLFARGRQQEVDNFENNISYFKALISNYTQKIIAQCLVYDIPYHVIDTSSLTENEVLQEAIRVINEAKIIKE